MKTSRNSGESTNPDEAESPILGALVGCAVGDALGLPYEGLTNRRAARLLGPPNRHRFFLGRGMVSDDTEHTRMVAQALCTSPRDPEAFERHLAWSLRWWLLGVPAGIGLATLRAILKLWMGLGPKRSGVYSAGNGPAMRSPILGAAVEDPDLLRALVHASTRITHTDPRAFQGALATAVAAHCSRRGEVTFEAYVDRLRTTQREPLCPTLDSLLGEVKGSTTAGEDTPGFAARLGFGQKVSGFVYQTVPIALHAWLSYPSDYRAAVEQTILCGGDTDTTAAIVGAIVGAGVGWRGIPQAWREGLWEWPANLEWMVSLASATQRAVQSGCPGSYPHLFWPYQLARNGVFLSGVFGHLARRALPPY